MFAGRAGLAGLVANKKAGHEEHEFIPRPIITDQLAGAELRLAAEDAFGTTINARYAKPETGLITATCGSWPSSRFDCCGRVGAGRTLEVLDETGNIVPAGTV